MKKQQKRKASDRLNQSPIRQIQVHISYTLMTGRQIQVHITYTLLTGKEIFKYTLPTHCWQTKTDSSTYYLVIEDRQIQVHITYTLKTDSSTHYLYIDDKQSDLKRPQLRPIDGISIP